MERALAAIRSGSLGFNECCRQYGIPKPTLKRHLDGKNVIANENVKCLGRTSKLPAEVENAFAAHGLKQESLLFRITIRDIRKSAYLIAQRNKILHSFNKQTQMAGKKWFYAFKNRHLEL